MSTDNENPMDKLARLGQVLMEKAREAGLEMEAFLPVPDLHGDGRHMVQAIFAVDMDVIMPKVEELDEDADVLAGILAATEQTEKEQLAALAEAEEDDRREAAKAKLLDLQERLSRDEPLLGD